MMSLVIMMAAYMDRYLAGVLPSYYLFQFPLTLIVNVRLQDVTDSRHSNVAIVSPATMGY